MSVAIVSPVVTTQDVPQTLPKIPWETQPPPVDNHRLSGQDKDSDPTPPPHPLSSRTTGAQSGCHCGAHSGKSLRHPSLNVPMWDTASSQAGQGSSLGPLATRHLKFLVFLTPPLSNSYPKMILGFLRGSRVDSCLLLCSHHSQLVHQGGCHGPESRQVSPRL